MVPTEILAFQHFEDLSPLFKSVGISCELLTGSTPKKAKNDILARLKSGDLDFVIGTHALIQESVEFKNLGLVITDEQHRFGVAQREALTQKGAHPHVIVMSATPIPRTLALILYADLNVSQIDELPAGRKPIETYAVGSDLRERLYAFVKKQVQAGRQAYVICARAEEDESSELASVRELCEQLQSGFLADLRIDYLYGKMGAKKKEAVLQAFYRGELDVLVSTTVVEVGVNVPNATAMVIENAERFGLSQLHQLRGRIGRGSAQSYCILVSDSDTERLKVMTQTNDGFQISREDLKLRGPGEFFGTRQSGLVRFRIADLMNDMQTLITARDAAEGILVQDPLLTAPRHRALREAVREVIRRHNQTI
jgi:ATP-dependent DNA helicase RecG